MFKAIIITIALLITGACNTTEQARSTDEKSGFLMDYSMLKQGKNGEALQVYVAEDVQWQKYQTIKIETVALYAHPESELKKLEKKEIQNLLSLFEGTIQSSMKTLKVTEQPDENTIVLKVALTDGESSSPTMDTVSSIIPVGVALTYLSKVATGKHLSVGKASIEAELVDHKSGKRLMAAMDTRYGGKGLNGKFESWNDVKSAFKYWADKLDSRLKELQK